MKLRIILATYYNADGSRGLTEVWAASAHSDDHGEGSNSADNLFFLLRSNLGKASTTQPPPP